MLTPRSLKFRRHVLRLVSLITALCGIILFYIGFIFLDGNYVENTKTPTEFATGRLLLGFSILSVGLGILVLCSAWGVWRASMRVQNGATLSTAQKIALVICISTLISVSAVLL